LILKALCDYAERCELVADMAVRDRPVHLILRVDTEGRPLSPNPWESLTREAPDFKKPGKMKTENFRALSMPEYPGVNAGGKAHFLADSAEKVLGLSASTGEPIPADGKNPAKAFEHYWTRIADAHAETADPELAALLKFRDLHLTAADRKATLAGVVGLEPVGKDGTPTFSARTPQGPVPLEGKTIAFQVGRRSEHVFAEGSRLRDYWKGKFARERFAESPAGSTAHLGTCLVTGAEDVPIAEVHRTLIKGVPGLPPIGGYVVSFDEMTPSLRSYGFEKGWNAPVSEDAAAAYALGLNHILAQRGLRIKTGNAVLCSWVDREPEAGALLNDTVNAPTADAPEKFFEAFREGGRFGVCLDAASYRSLTLAANGGRVVVRRWLDVPLREAVGAVRRWFDDLDVDAIGVPKKSQKSPKRRPTDGAPPPDAASEDAQAYNPLSVFALASTTARVTSEVRETTYDALYRAALDPAAFNPLSLLGPVLQRLRIAAVEKGDGVRFDTSRFALIKLILRRSGGQPMPVDRVLCECNDKPYNCGRLLAVLDDLQQAAQGRVGADIVSRFYGAASTYPANVFGRLLDLATAHEKKLKKSGDPRQRTKGWALAARVNDITSLFLPEGELKPPAFPTLLTVPEQGRFALGFHQQKAANDRAVKEYLAKKAAGAEPADPVVEALADAAVASPTDPE